MYPFKQYMKILKGYVRNRNQSEDCIVECYTYEEAIEGLTKMGDLIFGRNQEEKF